ncbi:MAG: hypothetical protein Q9171_005866 [Xanthocarpia ochracea]
MAQVQLKPTLKRKFKQTAQSAAVIETSQKLKFQQQQAQQQSFEIVYTLLHSSAIRTNAEEHYQDRTSHERSIKKRKDQADLIDPAASSHPLKLLVQDAHPGVNAFLHWLNGVLEGILKQTITAAQFCICLDPTDRSNVIESYTFRFHYHEGRHLGDLAVSGSSASPTSIISARKGLEDLLKGISSSIEKMPDLPETRFLTCHLFHLPDPRCDFRLYGFVASAERVMSVPDNSDWRSKTIEGGAMDSGYHRHIQLVGEEEVDPNDLYSIPEHMRHNRTLSRVFDTPKDQIGRHSNNSSINAWNRRVSGHVAGTRDDLQVPQSPLDALPASRSEGPTVPEASSDTMITNQSHNCLYVSQSVPDAVSATQELVGLPRPIQTQHRMELLRCWVRHLKKRAAPGWKVSVDGKHVHCQCKFNEREGEMVTQAGAVQLLQQLAARALLRLYFVRASKIQRPTILLYYATELRDGGNDDKDVVGLATFMRGPSTSTVPSRSKNLYTLQRLHAVNISP